MSTSIPTAIEGLLDPTATEVAVTSQLAFTGGVVYEVYQGDEDRGESFKVVVPDSDAAYVVDDDVAEAAKEVILRFPEFSDFLQEKRSPWLTAPAPPVDNFRTREDVESALFEGAKWGLEHNGMKANGVHDIMNSVSSGADTKYGRLACAWAVNQIAVVSLGKPVGGGLLTASMFRVLEKYDTPLDNEFSYGTIIISPSEIKSGRKITGHVGIIGADGLIYSNSSSRCRWEQNFDLDKWYGRFNNLGLSTYVYTLNPDRF